MPAYLAEGRCIDPKTNNRDKIKVNILMTILCNNHNVFIIKTCELLKNC